MQSKNGYIIKDKAIFQCPSIQIKIQEKPIKYPNCILPQSPINNFALGLLKNKNEINIGIIKTEKYNIRMLYL